MTNEEAISIIVNGSRSVDLVADALGLAVKALSAEPVRHGHWKLYYGEDDTPYQECSNCHTSVEDDWFYSGYENGHWVESGKLKYCPACGAKMDEVEE